MGWHDSVTWAGVVTCVVCFVLGWGVRGLWEGRGD